METSCESGKGVWWTVQHSGVAVQWSNIAPVQGVLVMCLARMLNTFELCKSQLVQV